MMMTCSAIETPPSGIDSTDGPSFCSSQPATAPEPSVIAYRPRKLKIQLNGIQSMSILNDGCVMNDLGTMYLNGDQNEPFCPGFSIGSAYSNRFTPERPSQRTVSPYATMPTTKYQKNV